MDGRSQLLFPSSEQFDAVPRDAMEAAGAGEFAQGDGLGGVEALGIEEVLDAVEVYRGELGGEAAEVLLLAFHSRSRLTCRGGRHGEGTHCCFSPLVPLTTQSGVWPPLNPAGTLPCCFWPL